MWAKRLGKEVDKCFGNVELRAMKTMEQPTLDQRDTKSTKTLILIEVFPQTKGSELNRPFIHIFFSFIFFLLYPFFLLFLFFFSSFVLLTGKEKHQRHKFMTLQVIT